MDTLNTRFTWTILLCGAISAAAGNNQLYSKSSFTNLRLDPMRTRLTGVTLGFCGVECELTTNCVSFSYHSTGLCELNRYNPNDVLATNYSADGWEIYIKYPETCIPTTGYDGFIRGGTCYFWAQGTPEIPWSNAQSDCRANNAEMACIESEEENQALVDRVPMWLWWFGLNSLDDSSQFTCNAETPVFTKWSPSRPGLHPCIAVHEPDTMWYDGRCNANIAYVCEKQLYT